MPSALPCPPPTVSPAPTEHSTSAVTAAPVSFSFRNSAAITVTKTGYRYSSSATRLACAWFSALKKQNDWPT